MTPSRLTVRGPIFRVVGWGPLPLPGERRRHEKAAAGARLLVMGTEQDQNGVPQPEMSGASSGHHDRGGQGGGVYTSSQRLTGGSFGGAAYFLMVIVTSMVAFLVAMRSLRPLLLPSLHVNILAMLICIIIVVSANTVGVMSKRRANGLSTDRENRLRLALGALNVLIAASLAVMYGSGSENVVTASLLGFLLLAAFLITSCVAYARHDELRRMLAYSNREARWAARRMEDAEWRIERASAQFFDAREREVEAARKQVALWEEASVVDRVAGVEEPEWVTRARRIAEGMFADQLRETMARRPTVAEGLEPNEEESRP